MRTPTPTLTPTLTRTTLALALTLTLITGCVGPAVPAAPGPDATASDASDEGVSIVDAGVPRDSGGDAVTRARPTMTDEEAFRWARSLDPQAFEGLATWKPLDFAVLGPVDAGVTLWVRGDEVPYDRKGCVAIPVQGDAHQLTGEVSRRWREQGDTITEGYTVELGGAASLLGPGRTTLHADGSSSVSATGCLHVMGHLSELRADRVAYRGCPLRIASVACAGGEEHVYEGCPEGRRTCTTCRRIQLDFTSMGSCMVSRSSLPRVRVTTPTCAPCAPAPLSERLPELERELVGRDVTYVSGSGPTFFKSRAACDAQKKE